MNRDELGGKAEALTGRIKQAAGTLTRDPDLHDEDVIDEVAGKARSAVGHTQRKLGEAIEHVGKSSRNRHAPMPFQNDRHPWNVRALLESTYRNGRIRRDSARAGAGGEALASGGNMKRVPGISAALLVALGPRLPRSCSSY